MNIEQTPNYGELKRLSDAIKAENDPAKRDELIKERNKLLDPRMGMLRCGITRGNNNIIGLIVAKIPIRGEFDFKNLYNSIPQEDFNKAHGHIGSWASPVTGGIDVCFDFLKEEEFINSTSDKYKCKLTEKGLSLREKGDYEKYVDFILSEKNRIGQLEREGRQLAHRQATLAERQVSINFWIAVWAGCAAFYYLLEIHIEVKKYHPHLYALIFPYELTAWGALGTTISLWLILRYCPKKRTEDKKQ